MRAVNVGKRSESKTNLCGTRESTLEKSLMSALSVGSSLEAE